jgi:hypothetical protein
MSQKEAIKVAFKALDNVLKEYPDVNKERLVVIDYTQPSSMKRLYLINDGEVEEEYFVAHGANSGGLYATRFSNVVDSHQSNIGVAITAEVYNGKYGRSLKIKGLDKGYNDRMYSRVIVFHGSTYVRDDFIKQHGMCGRSWGCPAIDDRLVQGLIDKIKDKTLVLFYYPSEQWLKDSKWLK